eukprot:tig00021038_g17552.t1
MASTGQFTEEQISEIADAFSNFDTNGDGSMTKAEIVAVMASYGQTPTDAEIQNMINEFDTDGNGIIVFSEVIH